MTEIFIDNTLPCVFSERTDIRSDVWKKELKLERGKKYLIEAESGSGKTSLCSFLIGQRSDYLGKICFDKTDIRQFRPTDWADIRCRHISSVFQEMRIFAELSGWENVVIKNNLTKHKTESEILDWFQRLGLGNHTTHLAGKMSLGQQQRIALMRSLTQPFDFIIADEPVSHLDEENAIIMAELMKEEAEKNNAGIIVTSIGKRLPLDYDYILKL